MLRDAGLLGYRVADLRKLYDPRFVSRVAKGRDAFVCRQTGTSLEMIERHYGDARLRYLSQAVI
jgi:hypothetical protein